MKESTTEVEKDKLSGIKENLFSLVCFGLVVTGFVFVSYIIWFHNSKLSHDPNDWAAFGSYIGGVLGPFFAFLSVFALLLTIIYQRGAQEKQDKALYKQNFESSFFQMLNLYNQIVENIQRQYSWGTVKGRDALEKFQSILIDYLTNPRADTFEKVAVSYNTLYKEYNNILGHYYRNLYMIIKFIDESDLDREDKNSISNRKKYTSIVRAQLSNSEQILLFYNCISERGIEKFYPLMNKYSFFENLDIRLLRPENIVQAYEQKAFGDKMRMDERLIDIFKSDNGEYRSLIEKRREEIKKKLSVD